MSATAAPERLELTVPGEPESEGVPAHKFSIADYYTLVSCWGMLRWLSPFILLGGATAIRVSKPVPGLVPFAIVNEFCVHLLPFYSYLTTTIKGGPDVNEGPEG
ncbi:hypothetical protein ABOM_002896 [Aspergillus bombycis]|uniref:Uncharacterized protein n=1 Tax=Aspergillus bombycis TaxID=109264 RepID=A0A1F8A8I2_9EURO|nr:hypothetical protein ABOM_002896 [Aspergillus bombycis]OGM48090.1 hypothetical protein ABOM_002896 [Aspergillus bombycis]